MSKHTPGPWKVERRWNDDCEIVPRITCAPDDDRGCGRIADMVGAPYIGHESTLPNAYLIAAAPDLLAACKAAHELTIKYARPGDDQGYQFSNAVTGLLREAIAKAEGLTPTCPPGTAPHGTPASARPA